MLAGAACCSCSGMPVRARSPPGVAPIRPAPRGTYAALVRAVSAFARGYRQNSAMPPSAAHPQTPAAPRQQVPQRDVAVLDGVLERVTFSNPETGYTIARIAPDRGTGRGPVSAGTELITAVGPLLGGSFQQRRPAAHSASWGTAKHAALPLVRGRRGHHARCVAALRP